MTTVINKMYNFRTEVFTIMRCKGCGFFTFDDSLDCSACKTEFTDDLRVGVVFSAIGPNFFSSEFVTTDAIEEPKTEETEINIDEVEEIDFSSLGDVDFATASFQEPAAPEPSAPASPVLEKPAAPEEIEFNSDDMAAMFSTSVEETAPAAETLPDIPLNIDAPAESDSDFEDLMNSAFSASLSEMSSEPEEAAPAAEDFPDLDSLNLSL